MKPTRILSSYTDPSVQLEAEIDALKEDWYEKLDHLQIHTPDPAFNTMINTWNDLQLLYHLCLVKGRIFRILRT